MHRIFILSPAKTTGARASLLYSAKARFPLAREIRTEQGAPLGNVFSFLSGLYFRGKLAYARRFARPPRGIDGVFVITSNRGLLRADTNVTLADLLSFSEVPIDPREARYVNPIERDARRIARLINGSCGVIFLGSIGTSRYVETLLPFFAERLLFPRDFVGRGDMSRGGLLLRCVAASQELDYASLAGAIRHGNRPPKLAPIGRASPQFQPARSLP